jgi:tRNA/tmRNA/rRNA uracil-C5-methylase (TrmA/RlmC/RlmD family)
MPLPRHAQAQLKLERLAAALAQAGVAEAPLWATTGRQVGYRNRLRLQVGQGGEVRFFNPNKLQQCVVAHPDVLQGIGVVRQAARVDPSLVSGVTHLELRATDDVGNRGLRLCGESMPVDLARRWTNQLGAGWIVMGPVSSGAPCQRWRVAPNVMVHIPLDAFMQINSEVNRLLVGHVVEGLVARGVQSFVDLYMGAGNFALPLAAAGLSGTGVERSVSAARAAREAARCQGFGHLTVVEGDARRYAERHGERGGVDAVVCDPPRAGLADAVTPVAALAARHLVLCSCHVPSLSRDLKALADRGLAVERVTAFDMFPQTEKLEVVVWLSRVA